MAANISVYGRKAYSQITQSFGTVIVQGIDPFPGGYTTLAEFRYTSGSTVHAVSCLRELGRATFAADANASQATVVLNRDPGVYSAYLTLGPRNSAPRTANNAIAANDYVCYMCSDGTYVFDKVASGSYSALVLTANLPTGGVKKGDPLWMLGIYTDLVPFDGRAHFLVAPTASVQSTFGGNSSPPVGILTSPLPNSPMMLYSSNGTAAGSFDYIAALYTNR